MEKNVLCWLILYSCLAGLYNTREDKPIKTNEIIWWPSHTEQGSTKPDLGWIRVQVTILTSFSTCILLPSWGLYVPCLAALMCNITSHSRIQPRQSWCRKAFAKSQTNPVHHAYLQPYDHDEKYDHNKQNLWFLFSFSFFRRTYQNIFHMSLHHALNLQCPTCTNWGQVTTNDKPATIHSKKNI